MSVYIYATEDLQKLCDELVTQEHRKILYVHCPPDFSGKRPLPEKIIALELMRAQVAQSAAWFMSYCMCDKARPEDTPQFIGAPLEVGRCAGYLVDAFEVAETISNVLYNCISNGGTDFCPRETRANLESWASTLYRAVAEKSNDRREEMKAVFGQ